YRYRPAPMAVTDSPNNQFPREDVTDQVAIPGRKTKEALLEKCFFRDPSPHHHLFSLAGHGELPFPRWFELLCPRRRCDEATIRGDLARANGLRSQTSPRQTFLSIAAWRFLRSTFRRRCAYTRRKK